MKLEDLVLVSVDDHVVEPPDLFEGHMPARLADRAPRVVRKDDGTDVWVFEGVEIPNIGLNAVAGRPQEEWGIDPTSFDEMRAGCFDVHARVRDMNVNGVLGSMCFPSFPGFAGRLFAHADPAVALTVLQAYNDWHVDEWCGTYPGRFIPLGLTPIWDPAEMAKEVRRLSAKGCHAVSFSENPEKLGFKGLHDEWWEPFWSACSDEGTVVCLHIGSSGSMPVTSVAAPIDVLCTLGPINIVGAAADIVWSRVIRKFPSLMFALSEGGIGWIPYFLERVDRWYTMQHVWTGQDLGDRLPGDIFRRQVITCFIDDPVGIKLRHEIGVDSITWECDYPHTDSTWPRSPETLEPSLRDLSDDEVAKITHRNAMRLLRYDPFAHIPEAACTVGALRAQATDVDVTTPSVGKRRIDASRTLEEMVLSLQGGESH